MIEAKPMAKECEHAWYIEGLGIPMLALVPARVAWATCELCGEKRAFT
jgi:hypothetical protein